MNCKNIHFCQAQEVREAGILHLSVTVVDLVSSSEHRPQPLQGVFVLVLSFNFNFLELQKRAAAVSPVCKQDGEKSPASSIF
ncbi:hypothetical protein AB205_0155420 [Aquarana catesbeiana]|uniref:Uncharacterized protein n=1 Tax=Aquarana catesbeiana TaxID=8400 RepID=A0A2G9SCK7_AQUCT|nr:hypothetical protein AB205_0155420 [Aquarana catesbeiana]